jgi:hypothetical protein
MNFIFILLGLLARITIIAIPILVINKYKDTLILSPDQWTFEAAASTMLSLILIVAADYIKDFAKNHKAKKIFNPLQRASRETGGTVATLLELGKFESNNCDKAIESALRQIETIVEVSLGKSRREGHEISANCMTHRTQRKVGASLTLTHWGTRLAGREPITIKLGQNLPGAPEAIEQEKINYIKDTQSKELANLFRNKSYRSILSIPLISGSKKIGVINIDSEEESAFGKIEKFKKEVIPLISPQIDTIKKLIPNTKEIEHLASSPDNRRNGG